MQETPEAANSTDGTPAGELAAPGAQSAQPQASKSTDGPPLDAASGLEERLKKAELAAAEHHDAWLRAKAEADNIRKRARGEIGRASCRERVSYHV